MTTINTTESSSTEIVVLAGIIDPVVNVTESGAVIGIGYQGIVAQSEFIPYAVDVSIAGLVAAAGAAGIWLRDNGGTVSVAETGAVYGSTYGVVSFNTSTEEQIVRNAGLIAGATAVSLGAVGDQVENTGTIHGFDGIAIDTHAGADVVTNRGTILGDILLEAGNDRFIAEAGSTVDGTINGGLGDDRFWIVDNSLTLADDGGTDKILSAVSHTLGADFENLTLLGSRDLDASGNASGNVLVGNAGDNTLRGYAGADTLKGDRGDDTLFGGTGADTLDGGRGRDVSTGGDGHDIFVFSTNSGRDTILDFDPSSAAEDVDLGRMESITGYSDLANNHMTQVGDDVVIDGGGGDVLRLVGIDIGDLDASDFLF